MDSPKPTRLSAVKLALMASRMRADSGGFDPLRAEPVAIIGMGCRFPGGCDDPEAFWRLLEEGRDAIGEAPAERWDADGLADPAGETAAPPPWGGFLEGVDGFDAEFFGIAPREAVRMDPQQRLVLEVGWEALEDAGQTRERLRGSRSGVFLGLSYTDYRYLQYADWDRIEAYDTLGTAHAVVSNRLSYVLDLQGPSLAVDTLCSSSLVAIHLACQSLRSGESDLAISGGVFLMTGPEMGISLAQLGALAPDGRCKVFDARADGFGRAEGCGVVILKRLSDALADRDPIRALIRGSAVNQCGHTNGISAPSGLAQAALVREALANAGLEPADIDYIEAHGTGTRIGDPIEVGALAEVFAEASATRPRPCRLGSVKANVGHLEPAAGVAGLIRIVLSLEHQAITGNPHFRELNPEIARGEMPFVIPVGTEPWPAGDAPRYAGVSAFGMGGSNAHVLLEEAPRAGATRDRAPARVGERPWLLPISAHVPEALRSLARSYGELAAQAADDELGDVCYSSAMRRTHHRHRLVVIGRSGGEIAERLRASDAGKAAGVETAKVLSRQPGLTFAFSGQGSQWAGMGRQLAACEPVFRRTLERLDELFGRHASWSLLSELRAEGARSRLHRTEIAQPAIFAVEVALAELWRSWGVEPEAVVGHSVGEVAAACVAGVLSLEDAVRVVFHRGEVMADTAGRGAMAAVGLAPEQAAKLLADRAGELAIAAINGPESTVLSGDPEALATVMAELEGRQVFCRRVKVNYAFHSPQMDPCAEALERRLGDLEPGPAQIPIFSTVDGRRCAAGEPVCDAAYWARNVRSTVRFADAVDAILDDGHGLFVEVGGHPVLAPAIRQCRDRRGGEGLVVPSLRRDRDEPEAVLSSLGALWAHGYPVDWEKVCAEGTFHPRLPRYPWQHRRYWIEPDPRIGRGSRARAGRAHAHPLLARRQRAVVRELGFETPLGREATAYLTDHRLYGLAAVPAAAYLEMALALAGEAFGPGAHEVAEVRFERALFLPEEDPPAVRIELESEDFSQASFRISSPASRPGTWTVHATGTLRRAPDAAAAGPALDEIRGRCVRTLSPEEHYRAAAARGLEYGPAFRGVEEIRFWDREVLGRVDLPDDAALRASAAISKVHPAILDACIQLLLVLLPAEAGAAEVGWLPVGLAGLRLYRAAATAGWCHARLRSQARPDADAVAGDLTLLDDDGEVILEARELRLQRLDQRLAHSVRVESWMHSLLWEAQPLAPPAAKPGSESRASWLLYADDGDCATALAARLEARGDRVVAVVPGEEYARLGAARFKLRAAQREDYERLMREAPGPGAPPWRGLIHLWGLRTELPKHSSAQRLEALSTPGWISLLHAVQAAQAGSSEPPQLWLVTRGAQSLGAHEPAAPAQAPLLGLARTLAREHPELRVRMVDLSAEPQPREAEALEAEIVSQSPEEEIALRAEGRFAARLARVAPGELGAGRERRLRPDATYLLTGGLGGLGLAIAGWMVDQGARHLLLIDRSSPTAAARAALTRLEAAGARIEVARADVSHYRDLTRIRARIAASMPPLAGVVHAAGLLADAAFCNQTAEGFRTVMGPKILGAWNLHRLTRDLEPPPDFFVLFSSVAAVLGSPGQANYAAANAFLDALAQWRRAAGLPALSIAWGPWGEVGMAARTHQEDRLGRIGFGTIAPELGLAALGRLLDADAAQVMVMPFDAAAWARRLGGAPPLVAQLIEPGAGEATAGAGDLRAAVETAAPDERQRRLVAALGRELGRQLGLDPARLDPRQPLFEVGIDSLIAVEMNGRIRDALGVNLPLLRFFQGGGIDDLATQILAELAAPPPASSPAELKGSGEAAATAEFPLSHGQHALWVEYKLDRENWAYNALFAVRLESPLAIAVLERSFRQLALRHPALRTTFRQTDGVPVQEVHPDPEIRFEAIAAPELSRAEVERRLREEARRPFDLERGPIMRVVVVSRSPVEHGLLVVAHHMAVDLWSLAILLRELDLLYAAETAGEEATLPPMELEYRDYVDWQRRMLAGPEGERLEAYWREQLAGEIQALDLPFDRPRPRVRKLTGAGEFIELDPKLTHGVKALARDRRTTLFATLLAAFQALLHRITGQDDIQVCSPMSGRTRSELSGVVGHFVNTVPLRSQVAGDQRFCELLDQVQGTVLGAVDHQDYPSLVMVQRLARSSRTSLFDVEIALNAASIDAQGVALTVAQPGARATLGGMAFESIDLPQQAGQFEIGLELYETGETFSGMLQYRPDLLDATTIHRLVSEFRVLLAGAAAAPEDRLSALPLLTPAERHQLAVELPAATVRVAEGGVVAGRAYVLDPQLRPVPLGCVGTIAVSRDGRGPEGPEAVADWVPDPFTERGGQYLFLTRERGRIRATGELERLDPGPAGIEPTTPAVAERPDEGPPQDPEAELAELFGEVLDELGPAGGDGMSAGED